MTPGWFTPALRARGAAQAILPALRWHSVSRSEEQGLATPNYSYEKRQRELAKKRKAEEKRMRKLSGKPDGPEDGSGDDAGQAEEAGTAAGAPAEPPQG